MICSVTPLDIFIINIATFLEEFTIERKLVKKGNNIIAYI